LDLAQIVFGGIIPIRLILLGLPEFAKYFTGHQ